jgi:extracellular factor (EF) 3-hydroxypalmitic acid methyl ester biosynthesis protein
MAIRQDVLSFRQTGGPAKEAIQITWRLREFLADLDVSLMREWISRCSTPSPMPLKSEQAQDALNALLEDHALSIARFLDESYGRLTELDVELEADERSSVVRHHRALIHRYFLESSFVRRSLDRPLGYPGDYLLVEQLFNNQPDGASPLGLSLSRYALDCGPARAHRSRLPWAKGHLQRLSTEKNGHPLRILSFACGPEHILRDMVASGFSCQLTLVDFDRRALEFCSDRFKEISRTTGQQVDVRYVELSAFKIIRDPMTITMLQEHAGNQGYDALLILGLLDYLTVRQATRLLDGLTLLLRPEGRLLLTNVSDSNPWRSFMEWIGDWTVYRRSQGDFLPLAVGTPARVAPSELTSDPTGTNVFFVGSR